MNEGCKHPRTIETITDCGHYILVSVFCAVCGALLYTYNMEK